MRRQLELSNEAATALSDPNGAIVAELRRHINSQFHLRGNLVTLEGDEDAGAAAAAKVGELAALVDRGHELAPGTVDAVSDADSEPMEHPASTRAPTKPSEMAAVIFFLVLSMMPSVDRE